MIGLPIVLLGGCVAAIANVAEDAGKKKTTASSPKQADQPAQEPAATESEPAPQAEATPSPSDFEIEVKVLKKACFGSAGCNVTYRINPGYSGPDLGDDQKFDVVYEVRGGTDGAQVNTFTMEGERASFDAEEFLSTPSSGTKLTAKVKEILGS
ncbi:hypothetical protein [Planomonospora parontospora]|uniref:hypothetical protein n=1 Tax=Planomonospora parontospora TaxID=58119 RepID=UPI00177D572E|nr:hypothetical protein [Planomonospora parontospora]